MTLWRSGSTSKIEPPPPHTHTESSLSVSALYNVNAPFITYNVFLSHNPHRQEQGPVNFHDIPFVRDYLSVQWVSPQSVRHTTSFTSKFLVCPQMTQIGLSPFKVPLSRGCRDGWWKMTELINQLCHYTNVLVHRYVLHFVFTDKLRRSRFVSFCVQPQVSPPSVSAAEWGSSCSAHPGFLEGIQGTLDL